MIILLLNRSSALAKLLVLAVILLLPTHVIFAISAPTVSNTNDILWSMATSSTRSWIGITSSSDGAKLAVSAYPGYIHTSTDFGVTWTTRITSGSRYWGKGIGSSSDGVKLVAANISGYIYTSVDSGATWVARTAAGYANWFDVTSSSDGSKLAASGYQNIFTSTNSGSGWTPHNPGGSLQWVGVDSSSDGAKLVALGNDDYIYTSTDSGSNWTQRTTSGDRSWRSITSSSDGANLAATVYPGYIYTSTDSGANWVTQTASGQRNWISIDSSSDGTKLVAADTGGYIYTSLDSGVTWATSTSSGIQTWSEVVSSSDGSRLAAITSNGSIYTTTHADAVSSSSATLLGNITATGDEDASQHGFVYGTDPTLSVVIATTTLGSYVGTGAFTQSLTGLSRVTTYYVRAYATNSAGTGYGAIFSFRTLPEKPVLTTSPITRQTITSVILNGYVDDVGGSSIPAQSSGFVYGTDPTLSSGDTATTSSYSGISNPGAIEQSVSDLLPGSTYYVRSYATNAMGTGYGPIISFRFEPEVFLREWRVRISSAGSDNWSAVTSSSDGTKLAAVEINGYISTSSDSGATWTTIAASGSKIWQTITSSSDGSKLAAAVYPGYIYTSTDSGATWVERTTSGSRYWRGVTSSSDGAKLVGVVDYGYIYTSTDSGANWTERIPSGSDSNTQWYGVTSSSDGTKLAAVSSSGYIYTSTNSGVNWTQRTGAGSRNWYSVASSADGTKLAAVDKYGYIYTSTDSGANWTVRPASGVRDWNTITSSSDGVKLSAVVDAGYIYISTDSGVTWATSTSANYHTWRGVTSSSDGTKLAAVASDGAIYTATLPMPIDVSATSISGIYGTISNISGADVSEHGFSYSTDPTFVSSVSTTTLGSYSTGDGDFTEVLSLSPATLYYVRPYATNSAGTGYGDVISTTTLVSVPLITTSTASSITTLTATLNAQITATGGFEATQSGFAYGTSTTLATVIATTTLGAQTGTASFASSVSGLTCNTTYYTRAYATNSIGVGYGDVASFVTAACLPTITTQSASGITTTAAIMNGDITATGGADATEHGFAYGTVPDLSAVIATTTLGSRVSIGAFTGNLSGLSDNTTYYFRPYATNSAGTNFGTIVSFITSARDTAPSNTSTSGSSASGQISRLISMGYYDQARAAARQYGLPDPIPGLTVPVSVSANSFNRSLGQGMRGDDVRALQVFLNSRGFTLGSSGPGSPGQETDFFGPITKAAVMRFQQAYKEETLDPQDLPGPTGFVGRDTRGLINSFLK